MRDANTSAMDLQNVDVWGRYSLWNEVYFLRERRRRMAAERLDCAVSSAVGSLRLSGTPRRRMRQLRAKAAMARSRGCRNCSGRVRTIEREDQYGRDRGNGTPSVLSFRSVVTNFAAGVAFFSQ
jgi:hypothetical protein